MLLVVVSFSFSSMKITLGCWPAGRVTEEFQPWDGNER